MERFDIPVALMMFKRDKALDVLKRIACVKPKKLYLLADQGRNEEERAQAENLRRVIENAIDWDCEVIKRYAENNVGVYENIGKGAQFVLEREKWAIFLEDDNLPEVSFFYFCKEMLARYENDTRVLWICGTNYLGDYKESEYDYVFTKHMLPCGWASWANKFPKFYDGDLKLVDDKFVMDGISQNYCNKKVYKQYKSSWMSEYNRIKAGKKPVSWDFQMDLTIKAHSLYGICPCKNQIKNIGVDALSEHGGTSFDNIMTKRFCGMDSYEIKFPLKHPPTLLVDEKFEKKIGKIILFPLRLRLRIRLAKFVRRILKKRK